jgi:chemotaxis methyl-accepting protein methylase
VVGVDRSSVALAQARAGAYEAECQAHIPAPYAEYVEVEPNGLRVGAALRPHVSFAQRDLLAGPPPGNYDVIVCKNLLIYLSQEASLRVLRSLFLALAPRGLLFLARAELPKAKALELPVVPLAPGISVVQAP